MDENVGKVVVKAIRTGKWMYITYLNQRKETTKFWLAVEDLEFIEDNVRLKGHIYNPSKDIDNAKAAESGLFLSNVQTAKIIDFTEYNVSDSLLNKLDANMGRYKWLDYEQEIGYLLNYYEECNWFDKDPYQREHVLIPGIDLHKLMENQEYVLTKEQKEFLIRNIYDKYTYNKTSGCYTEFAISKIAIDKNNRLYVVCYYNVNYNPERGTLNLDKTLRFNKTFIFRKLTEYNLQETKISLMQYAEMDVDAFIREFNKDNEWGCEIIRRNLKSDEMLNTRPEMMILERDRTVDVRTTYNTILERDEKGLLNVPLKSLFGRITGRDKRRKEPNIIIFDDKINVDQTRVLYNAMKQPVTYVQGPPGTGKTQAILNVVLNGFYNGKTMLVCSSNNKPVDDIINKLQISYKGEKIPFPFIRLGNNTKYVIPALDKIKELFDYTSTREPDDNKINQIKINTDNKNESLNEILKRQEKHVQLVSFYEDAQKLYGSVNEKTNQFSNNVKKRIEEIQDELKKNPEVNNYEVLRLFTPLKEDSKLIQWMYFTSLKYIRELQKPMYNDLYEICNIEDEAERIDTFNKWLGQDSNMRKFVKAFPVIFTTNISAQKLGSPNFMFDLVIMDEAGQCNIAQSIIPIAKANSLLLVGDPEQLKPIVVIEDSINKMLMGKYSIPEDYDYKQHSILDVMINHDSISQYVLLKYHYRCGKKIIDFSNKKYYESKLNLSAIKENGELVFIPTINKNIDDKNTALEEIEAIIDYLKRNNYTNTTIITPFANQRELINLRLKQENLNDNVKCDTVHAMQGGESDTIILSTALSTKTQKRTFEWIKNNTELINVAVSRAKKRLVVACDEEVLFALSKNTRSDIVDLINYVKSNGKSEVPLSEALEIVIGKSNNSYYEKEFYKTISHFCSVNKTFEAERNVSFSKIFANDNELKKLKSEFDCVLYKKSFYGKIPKIVIEINGGEHFGDKKREMADKRKAEICQKKGIELIMIPNTFVKSYEQLREIIIKSKNRNDTQLSLFDGI